MFRPYAASVLAEYCGEFFDLDIESPYMLIVTQVLEGKRDLIPGVCHIDNTCRVQMVPPDFQGEYRRLIESFMELTGVPLVLDTSSTLEESQSSKLLMTLCGCFLGTKLGYPLSAKLSSDKGND